MIREPSLRQRMCPLELNSVTRCRIIAPLSEDPATSTDIALPGRFRPARKSFCGRGRGTENLHGDAPKVARAFDYPLNATAIIHRRPVRGPGVRIRRSETL
jgi:hypothetical protein